MQKPELIPSGQHPRPRYVRGARNVWKPVPSISTGFRTVYAAVVVAALGFTAPQSAAQGDGLDFLYEDAPEESTDDDSGEAVSGEASGPQSGEVDRGATPEREADMAAPADPAPPEVPGEARETASQASAEEEVEVIRLDEPEEPAFPEASARRRSGLEEIVVTARRREELLSDVPISVSAFSGEELAIRGIADTRDLVKHVPGMAVSQTGGFGHVFLRGLGSNAFVPFVDPTVANLIDGVYAPVATSAVQLLGNIESIEVLKGPQGTLFGRNTTAGVVQIRTKDPTDEFQARIKLGAGSRNLKDGSISLSGPIFGDFAGIWLGAYSREIDAHETNINPSAPELRPTKDEGFVGKLLVHPTDWMEIKAYGSHSTHDGAEGSLLQVEDPALINLGQPTPQPRVGVNNVDPFGTSESDMLNLKVTAQFEPVEAWIQATRTETDLENFFDGDGSGVDEARLGNTYFWEETTYEAQLASNRDWSFFGMPVSWLVGGFFLDSEGGMEPVTLEFPLVQTAVTLLGLPPITQDTLLDQRLTFNLAGAMETEEFGFFGSMEIGLLDWLTLDLGLRYSNSDRAATNSSAALDLFGIEDLLVDLTGDGLFGDGVIIPPIPLLGGLVSPGLTGDGLIIRQSPDQTLNFENVSPLVGLNFHLPDGSLLYVKYSEGFKPGTWNLLSLLSAPDAVPEETVESYEVGIKTKLLDGLLEINAAAFNMDYEGLQAFQIILGTDVGGIVRSIDESRTRGVEVDTTFLVPLQFQSNDKILLGVSAAYLDSEILDWPDAPTFGEIAGFSQTADNLAGNRLHNAPEWTTSIDLGYDFDLLNGRVSVGTSYYYNSGVFFDPQNLGSQGSYSLVDARISYALPALGLRATLIGKNLTGTDYRNFGITHEFGSMVTWAAAEAFELQLSWDF